MNYFIVLIVLKIALASILAYPSQLYEIFAVLQITNNFEIELNSVTYSFPVNYGEIGINNDDSDYVKLRKLSIYLSGVNGVNFDKLFLSLQNNAKITIKDFTDTFMNAQFNGAKMKDFIDNYNSGTKIKNTIKDEIYAVFGGGPKGALLSSEKLFSPNLNHKATLATLSVYLKNNGNFEDVIMSEPRNRIIRTTVDVFNFDGYKPLRGLLLNTINSFGNSFNENNVDKKYMASLYYDIDKVDKLISTVGNFDTSQIKDKSAINHLKLIINNYKINNNKINTKNLLQICG